MDRWTSRRILAALLGLVFAIGVSLSAAQAGMMSVKMSMIPGMDHSMQMSGNQDCGGCNGTGKGDMRGAACDLVCAPVFAAVLPTSTIIGEPPVSLPVARVMLPEAGPAPAPNPSPPRI
jgi:hypothetical protein